MKIWIDITNSPHVWFFEPIIKELKRRGHKIIITAINNQQTIPLLKQKNIKFFEVGKHFAKSKIKKGLNLLFRTLILWKFLRKFELDVSLSHGSIYCVWASMLLGIPTIYTMDGDAAFWNIAPALPFANKIIISEHTSKEKYVRWGAKASKIIQYPGLKEEIYLHNFKPNKMILKELNIDRNFIVLRPEATDAAYINKRNVLDELIPYLLNSMKKQVVFLPRSVAQRKYYSEKFPQLIIPKKTIDGPSLLAFSSAVISGGGTMNREAIVLGSKAISIYQEKLLSVDKWLIKNNYMMHCKNFNEHDILKAIKAKNKKYCTTNEGFKLIISEIEKGAKI